MVTVPGALVLASFYASASLVALSALLGRRTLRRAFSGVRPGTWRLLGLVVLLGAAARLASPYSNLPTGPDWIYLETGRSLLIDHRDGYCILGSVALGCERSLGEYPYGFPSALAASFSLLGWSDAAAKAVPLLSGIGAVAAVFGVARLAAGRDDAAILAALVMALSPVPIRYSLSTRSEGPAAFAMSVSLLALLLHLRAGTRSTRLLLASSVALAVPVRPEDVVLLAPVAAALLWRPDRAFLLEWVLGAALLAAYAPSLLGASSQFSHDTDWMPTAEQRSLWDFFSLDAVVVNRTCATLWLDGFHHPFLYGATFLLGLGLLRRRPGLALVALAMAAPLCVLLLHTHPCGPRYASTLYPQFAVLAGAGASWLARSLGPRGSAAAAAAAVALGLGHLPFAYTPGFGREGIGADGLLLLRRLHLAAPAALLAFAAAAARTRRARVAALALLLAALVVPPVLYGPGEGTDDADRSQFLEQELNLRFLEEARPLVPAGCYVAYGLPFYVGHVWGMRAVRSGAPEDIQALLERGDCIMLFDRTNCTGRACSLLARRFDLALVHQVEVPEEFVRLTMPTEEDVRQGHGYSEPVDLEEAAYLLPAHRPTLYRVSLRAGGAG